MPTAIAGCLQIKFVQSGKAGPTLAVFELIEKSTFLPVNQLQCESISLAKAKFRFSDRLKETFIYSPKEPGSSPIFIHF